MKLRKLLSTKAFPLLILTVCLIASLTLVGCGGSKNNNNNNNNSGGGETTVGLLPAGNATNVCVDTMLKITFDSKPTVKDSGTIKIYKASDDTVADTINLGDTALTITKGSHTVSGLNTRQNIIGNVGKTRIVNYYPLVVKDNTVVIVPHNNKLSYNTTYYVTVDNGALTGTYKGSAFAGITGKTAWKFTTKSAAPAGTVLSVNANGTADFCTIQGAVDNIPDNNTTPYTINIAAGTYEEMLYIYNKQNITLKGESKTNTIIQYNNYDSFNNGSGGGTVLPLAAATTVERGGRAILLVNGSSGLVIDNLTLQSTHGQNSAQNNQAEVMYLNGGTTDKYIVKNCNLTSYQDTIQCKSLCWFYSCFIAGDVDYVWGSATVALFENCELQTRYNSNGGFLVQARATKDDKGYVFLNCTLTKENNNVTGIYLARSAQTSVYSQTSQPAPNANYDNVTYLNCKMDTHILAEGWQYFAGGLYSNNYYYPAWPQPQTPDAINGWKEYNSKDISGNTLDVSHRSPGCKQLTATEYATNYGSRSIILNNWDPQP